MDNKTESKVETTKETKEKAPKSRLVDIEVVTFHDNGRSPKILGSAIQSIDINRHNKKQLGDNVKVAFNPEDQVIVIVLDSGTYLVPMSNVQSIKVKK